MAIDNPDSCLIATESITMKHGMFSLMNDILYNNLHEKHIGNVSSRTNLDSFLYLGKKKKFQTGM